MNKNRIYLLLLACIFLTACGAQASNEGDDKQTGESFSQTIREEEKSPDEVAQEEGIDAEQIIVKVTDDGFICLHGDHFHSYNTPISEDALWSKDLLAPDDYEWKEEDVVSSHEDGYFVKVDDAYYFYPHDIDQVKYMRDPQLSTDSEEKEAEEDPNQDLPSPQNRNENGEYTTSDGYVYNPEDVEEDLGDGFIVPHGDHHHYIPKAHLTEEEIEAGINQLGGK